MLADEAIPECHQCYQRQEAGASMRTRANLDWAHLYDELVEPSKPTGHLQQFKMAYFDIRFSNICNFKCRGCSPQLSSSWLSDHEKLFNYSSDRDKLISIMPNKNVWEELKVLIPTVEHAYFAGGEPLIMDEHYLILEELIAAGKTNIPISYNTNMSNLRFRDKHVQDYWSQFNSVSVSVSIDDFGARGEYFRNGTKWDKVVENILLVKTKCPHVVFSINCTISLFNVYYLPELHDEAVKLGLIRSGNILANLLLDPVEYRLQVLPEDFRTKVMKKFRDYLEHQKLILLKKDPAAFLRLKNFFSTITIFMMNGDNRSDPKAFRQITQKLDSIRNEDFVSVYPELAFLMSDE